MLDGRLGTIEGTFQVGTQHRVPILLGHHHNQGIACNSGIVDEDVQVSECIDCKLDEILSLVKLGDVCLKERCSTAKADNFFGYGLGCFRGMIVIEDHVCTASGKLKSDCLSDAAAGSGDQRNPIFKREHIRHPCIL